MKILHLTDFHGNSKIISKLENVILNSDIVIISGDITHFAHSREAKQIIDKIIALNSNTLAVSGNCDNPDVEEYLIDIGISIHKKNRLFENINFIGIGGSTPCPVITPNTMSEKNYSQCLNKLNLIFNKINILVSHQPPYNTNTDIIYSGNHVGSKAVADYLKAREIDLCLTGHIHESRGKDIINNCIILNPGPASQGKYGVININQKNITTEFKEL